MVLANAASDNVSVFRNASTSAGGGPLGRSLEFATPGGLRFTASRDNLDLAVADFDNDGQRDIISIREGAATVAVPRNTITQMGALSFVSFGLPAGSAPQRVAVADSTRPTTRRLPIQHPPSRRYFATTSSA